jgi:hypothetical protein
MKFLALIIVLFLFACESNDDNDKGSNSDIPQDPSGKAPDATVNNRVPAAKFSKVSSNRIAINLQGILDENDNPVTFIGDGSAQDGNNIFVTEDGKLKGIKVTNAGSGNTLQADIVFTIDNSGSMGQEADSIAARITDFVDAISNSGLDILVGVAGYSSSVNGALDLSSKDSLKAYLNRTGKTGTNRTRGFHGENADSLDAKKFLYNGSGGENGVEAIFFANDLFSWRNNTNRVFINFTDEPNQTGSDSTYTVKALCEKLAGFATVHTVFSADTSNFTWTAANQNPLEMSNCTGGTIKLIDGLAADLDLSNIPVIGALGKSAKIEFVTSNSAVNHEIIVTIFINESVNGKKVYTNVTY